jgi:tetratricopeptide (TPR) repeat protein
MNNITNSLQDFIKNRGKNILIFSLLFVISAILIVLGFINKPTPLSIRSALVIPSETSFLNRPELIHQIEEKLKGNASIPTVALVGIVGMGGVGKTTLARYFGSLYQASVVWEINAETHISLVNSFKDLATKLANTEKLKKELSSLQNIQDTEEREKKLLAFVKGCLKKSPNWLLIYDNVENFSTLSPYFPRDANAWGETGKVILTTRNANIEEYNFIKPENIIQIDALTTEEALTLFSKILYGCDPKKLSSDRKEKTLVFLKNIPPFPLDISVAAYYIKSNDLSYQQYLERIAKFNQDLESSQQALLKEIGTYEKTRYGIITSSLAKIVETNQPLQDLLLFTSLLDSQNIPRSLLEFYKDSALVDAFIHELKKYSLITSVSAPSSHQLNTFSIHRSTQAIILSYLTKVLNLERNQELIRQISIVFGNYINNIIKNEDLSELNFFKIHCEMFLSHGRLIPNNASLLIKGYLGCIFGYLRDDTKAEKYLEESLEHLSQTDLRSSAQICQIIIYLGNIYMEQGNYQKSKEFLDKALMYHKDYLSKDQVDTARSLVIMGEAYLSIGEHDKAKSALEQSLRIYEKSHDDPVGFARALGFMGNFYVYSGEYEKAKKYLEQSILIYKKHFPETSIGFAWAFVFLGNAYERLGDYEKAKSILEQGVKVYKENFLETHGDTAWAMLYLADVYMDLKKYKQAEEITKKSLEVYEKLFDKNSIRTAEAMLRLGNACRGLKDYQKAKDILKQTLIIYEQTYGKNHIRTAGVLKDLGLVYLLEDKLETAEILLVKALDIFQQNNHPDSYLFLENLTKLFLKKSLVEMNKGNLQQSQNLKNQAIGYLKQALTVVKERLPEDSPHIARIQTKLNGLLA